MTTHQPPNGAAPGWHPDPSGRFEFRYWNGERWTADVSLHGQRFIDQLELLAAASVADPSRPVGRSAAVTSFVVALSSFAVAWVPFLFVLGAIGAITACTFGVLSLSRIRRGSATGRNLAVWGVVISVLAAGLCVVGGVFTVAVVREVSRYFDPGKYQTSVGTCSNNDGFVTLDATILNHEATYRDYTVYVRYMAGAKVVDSDSVTVRRVAPLTKGTIHSTTFVDRALTDVTCTITDVEGVRP